MKDYSLFVEVLPMDLLSPTIYLIVTIQDSYNSQCAKIKVIKLYLQPLTVGKNINLYLQPPIVVKSY